MSVAEHLALCEREIPLCRICSDAFDLTPHQHHRHPRPGWEDDEQDL